MTLADLQAHCTASIAEHGYIVFTADQLRLMDADQAKALQAEFGARHLMLLPEHEIVFYQ
jgi:6-phosphogluconolactonase (cycloisomerase 2 family)